MQVSLAKVVAILKNAEILKFYSQRISTSLSHGCLHHWYHLILDYICLSALKDTFWSLPSISPISSLLLTPDVLYLRIRFISTSYHPLSIHIALRKLVFPMLVSYIIPYGFKLHGICRNNIHSGIFQ